MSREIEHFGWMLSLYILEKGKNDFYLQSSFDYSADVKPMINKYWFKFI